MRPLGQRVRGWIALGAFAASLTLPLQSLRHATLDDDAACAPVVLAGGHAERQFEPLTPSPFRGHCAICHWVRAVGGARTEWAVTVAAWLDPSESRPTLAEAWLVSATPIERPSRAPPHAIG
jgi:mono/diheme cytochrome c family protein